MHAKPRACAVPVQPHRIWPDVAAGRLDGFWEMGLKPWDIAAGVLLIQEAGGLIGHFDGTAGVPENGDILVGGERIFKALVEEFQSIIEKRKIEV